MVNHWCGLGPYTSSTLARESERGRERAIKLNPMFFNETVLTDHERQRGVKRRRPTVLYSLAESLFLATPRGQEH